MEYRYYLEGSRYNGAKVLARGNSRQMKHKCFNPNCRMKSLVRFVDLTTNDYVEGAYGKCDHANKCGYYLSPYKELFNQEPLLNHSFPKPDLPPRPLVSIPDFILNATLKGYEQNTFIMNLLHNIPFLFEEEDVVKVINMYHLGTVTKGYRTGAVTIPFIDIDENVRAIQAKQFDASNHTISTDFIHGIMERDYKQRDKALPEWLRDYLRNEKIVSCLFGEHLLRRYPDNPVALVEAPKTAVIGTLYYGFPDDSYNLLWLAVYNRSSFNYEKCKALKGRNVVVLPDLGALQDWTERTKMINKVLCDSNLVVNDLIEPLANENDKRDGLDLVDYLINFDWRNFRKTTLVNTENILPVEEEPLDIHLKNDLQEKDKVAISDWPVDELEDFFMKQTKWPAKIILDKAMTIINPEKFIESHLSTIRRNNGNPKFQPFLSRLQLLQKLNLTNPIHPQAIMSDAGFQILQKEFTSHSDWEHG